MNRSARREPRPRIQSHDGIRRSGRAHADPSWRALRRRIPERTLSYMGLSRDEIARRIEALVEEQRTRCLWYLRADYLPQSDSERLRVLEDIQRHGDLLAYRRAAELKRCLSQICSTTFVGS
jgi:hypothetical protein